MELKEYTLDELLPYEQPTKYIVESTKYDDSYETPVLTAGKSFILGYTDEKEGIFEKDRLPVIIFDDFTTASQFVNFPFKVKSSAMKILNVNTELVLPKYIYYRMQIIQIDHDTHKRYWIQHYSKIKISIPSIDEQAKIVEKIEEIFSQIDAGIKNLKKTKEQVEIYRQSVLVSAFKEVSDKTETIENLCESIVDCPHSTPKWSEEGRLCLRTSNFKRGYLDLSEKSYVTSEVYDERTARLMPKTGDVLYSREGSILGIACIIPKGIEPCLGQRMMLFRTGKKINNLFLMHYLNSPIVTNHVIVSKGGTGSPHINVGDIKKFRIPLISYDNQLNIVKFIDEKLSVCDQIDKTIDNALIQAEALRQSVLKKAFEGRLV